MPILLFMDLQDSVHYRNLSSFYPENNDLPHAYRIFNSVREEKEIPSVKRRSVDSLLLRACGAQELLVGRVRFLFTTTGFWLRRMALALRMAAIRRSGRYLFFRIMCLMLLRVARAFLLMVVLT